jgi:hypothetical protein
MQGKDAYVIFIRCPYCGDSQKHPDKMHLNIALDKGLFYCFRCSTGGRLSRLLYEHPEVIEKLSKSLITQYLPEKKKNKFPYTLIPPEQIHYDYLDRRKVLKFLKELTKFELYTFKERPEYVAFKLYDKLQARCILPDTPQRVKYLTYNLSEFEDKFYWDSLEFMKNSKYEQFANQLIITEGIFDAIRMKQLFPFMRVISTAGTNLNLYILHPERIKEVYLCYDADVNIEQYKDKLRKFLIMNSLNQSKVFTVKYKFPSITDPAEVYDKSQITFQEVQL